MMDTMRRRTFLGVITMVALLLSVSAWVLLDSQYRAMARDRVQHDLGPAVQVELTTSAQRPRGQAGSSRPETPTPTCSPSGAQPVPPRAPAPAGDRESESEDDLDDAIEIDDDPDEVGDDDERDDERDD